MSAHAADDSSRGESHRHGCLTQMRRRHAPSPRPASPGSDEGRDGGESGGILRRVVFSFHFSLQRWHMIKTAKIQLSACNFYYSGLPDTPPPIPKADVLMLICCLFFVHLERRHFIPEQWSGELSDGFTCRNSEIGLEEKKKNNSLCIAYLKAPQSSCCSHKGPVKR